VNVSSYTHERPYDVIVVGAGHAGCEAALAAARIGCRTLLLTMNLDLIAQMPCNPSLGGPAKGHLVREIAALGGEMARAADENFIQIRLLNASKGPAVQALRAQADKRLYSFAMKYTLEQTLNLDLKQGLVERILVSGERIQGIETSYGQIYLSRALILTTGTFLAGRILSGERSWLAGRAGEFPAQGLSKSLAELGLRLGRLQTNTPPRVDARTIDFSKTEPQPGSDTPLYFSFEPPERLYQIPQRRVFDSPVGQWPSLVNPVYPIAHQTAWRPQVPCYMVYTNVETHRIIRENLHRSPIASGFIAGQGPRYCPSIEEKIVRFGHKESHQIFLEPEGFITNEVYVQGFFTSMPEEVQLQMLHSVPALERASIMRAGYAIEYDFVPPDQTMASLQSKKIEGLFLAGQINGTSGYEEAAAQGLMAGINAARLIQAKPPILLQRDQAYIGVMIDDLVTKELEEPYRLLTSRAEYRLLLRSDNADLRLTPIGYEAGLISYERYAVVERKRQQIAAELARLAAVKVAADETTNVLLAERSAMPLTQAATALQLLQRPEVGYDLLVRLGAAGDELATDLLEQVIIEAKYAGYIRKQQDQVDKMRRLEGWQIPANFDYQHVIGMRNEGREKMERFRPATLGQASRIQGVSPADISILMVYLEKTRKAADAAYNAARAEAADGSQ
jgi:tRNA uridine 5-carboxymethylaminomethyl modification enzyme